MDIYLIASTAISFLTPYLVEGGKELTKGLGKDLWIGIKNLFSSDKEKELLCKLEKKPKDAKIQGVVEYTLANKLEESEDALKLISDLVEKLQVENSDKSKNELTIKGNENIVFQNLNDIEKIEINKSNRNKKLK